MITEEQIKNAYNIVKTTHPSNEWALLFAAYNEHNENKLRMSCGICYFKVLSFIQQKFNLEPKQLTQRNQPGFRAAGGPVRQPGFAKGYPPQQGRKNIVYRPSGKGIFSPTKNLGRRHDG